MGRLDGGRERSSGHRILVLGFFAAFLVAALFAADPGTSSATVAPSTADVKVVSLTIGTPSGGACTNPAPSEIPVATNFQICTRLTFHNNGPTNPADVSISRAALFAPVSGQAANECTITPTTGLLTFTNVATSLTMTRDENYTVNCSRASFHTFRVTNTLSPGPAGVTDPVPTNNSSTASLTVGVTALADFDIVTQVIRAADCTSAPPSTIPVNTNTVFCIAKTIHNFGPYGPTAADIFFRSSASPDCTITPFTSTKGAQLSVSVATVVTELFTVKCTSPSFHEITIENFLEPTDVHVDDPDGNEYMATSYTFAVLAPATFQIQSQTPGGPASAAPNQPFTLTVDTSVHNNGPGSVNVSIDAQVSGPAGCTAIPDAGNPAQATLAVSASVAIHEQWSVTCTGPGPYAFTIVNCLQHDDPHVNEVCETSTITIPGTPATSTPTGTATATATSTATATATSTATATATGTPTGTATATATGTPTGTATATGTPTGTATATATGTPTGNATATATGTPTGTATATATGTTTATATATVTTTATATVTSTATATVTNTATATLTNTATSTGTVTATPTLTPTPTITAGVTETPIPTPTPTDTPTATAFLTPTLDTTDEPTATPTLEPTDEPTAPPTATASPTALEETQTPIPTAISTSTPEATLTPSSAPVEGSPSATALGATATPGGFPSTGGQPTSSTTTAWLLALAGAAALLFAASMGLAAARVRRD